MSTTIGQTAYADRFQARSARFREDLSVALNMLYGEPVGGRVEADILSLAREAFDSRSEELKALDLAREDELADWFQRPEMIGYMCYPDRMAGNFEGLRERIPYLRSLGITYLHLLSVLKARPGDSDGGFAIADYLATNDNLGTIDDLEALTADFRKAGISLCLDFVFNHTAKEHEWARRAKAGEKAYQDYYFMYPDRDLPDQYETMLDQVFPATAPGNFTYEEACDKWVWTTFYPYQWDLNYHNPAVLVAMLDNLFKLANRGVEVFRLDAAIYAWKESGTHCRNLPQTHALLQVFRAAMSIVAPGVALKAEAVAGARHIAKYFGFQESEGKECQLAYHTAAMAALWDCLATEDVGPTVKLLSSLPKKPPQTSWIYYARCHDDIGWATLQDSKGADWSLPDDRLNHLWRFYAGETEDSFARGEKFQAVAGEAFAGSNGTLASLAGLEAAVENEDEAAIEIAVRRSLLMHAVPLVLDGIPLVYMGDESGLLNDYDYAAEANHHDGRWLHRPVMPAEHPGKSDPGHRILVALRSMIGRRKAMPIFHTSVSLDFIDTGNAAIMAVVRRRNDQLLLCLANFSGQPQSVAPDLISEMLGDSVRDENPLNTAQGHAPHQLQPYQCRWLVASREEAS